jgi:hypothetical protein
VNSQHKRVAEQKPLADQLAELVDILVPAGHVYTSAQRGKFDALYRELSKIDERKLSR